MKIAIVVPFADFSRSHRGAVGMVIDYQTGRSLYKDSIRIFTEEVSDPVAGLSYDFFRAGLDVRGKLKAVAEGIESLGADVIEVHQDLKFARGLAKRFGAIPVTLALHMAPPRSNLWNRIFRSLRFFPLKRILCVSEYIASSYRALYPEHKKRIMTLLNAIPLEDNKREAGAREKVIFWAGRSHPTKGLGEFAEAMERVLPELEGWRCAVACLGHDLTFARDVKGRFGASLEGRCAWFENLPHGRVIEQMKKAAIVVAPSNVEEAFSLSVLEAHIAGAAVVSSGRGGMTEVSGKEGALYLPEVSAEAIAEAVRHLAENEAERLALAKRGQDYVFKKHRIEDRAAELDALRRELTGRG